MLKLWTVIYVTALDAKVQNTVEEYAKIAYNKAIRNKEVIYAQLTDYMGNVVDNYYIGA